MCVKQIKAELRKADAERRQKERRQAAIDKGRNPNKKRGRHAQIVDEWDDLAKEDRLFKKFRSGKITKEQYDEFLYGPKDSKAAATGRSDSAESSSDEDTDSSKKVASHPFRLLSPIMETSSSLIDIAK
jgi:ATP-dependent RNA helicase DDX55/SPB4